MEIEAACLARESSNGTVTEIDARRADALAINGIIAAVVVL
jgi:hypothetical protein